MIIPKSHYSINTNSLNSINQVQDVLIGVLGFIEHICLDLNDALCMKVLYFCLCLSRFILDSERSEECIDFTMMCVFFVSAYSITSRNNAPISNYGGGQKLTFSNSFQKNREKQKKNDGKTGIFTQNQFLTKTIFLYGCNSKTNHCKNLKFSPNIYISSNFQNILPFFDVDKKNLDYQKVLKI
ncbi:Uncharacterized protein FWK35_00010054 [Aphis craccivora]|uniref:Uncharacterized protein n=1 Tax=Aphis craccivora TaxID=307492 RepID=A0A6G0ZLN4_APHCR|nr:Uncharacterized protein FWK35_00010054 [Aphis craccivora]